MSLEFVVPAAVLIYTVIGQLLLHKSNKNWDRNLSLLTHLKQSILWPYYLLKK